LVPGIIMGAKMTRATAHERGLDLFILPTREDAEVFAASLHAVTGRPTETFEEELTCGRQSYTIFFVAVTKRPRPVVTIVT